MEETKDELDMTSYVDIEYGNLIFDLLESPQRNALQLTQKITSQVIELLDVGTNKPWIPIGTLNFNCDRLEFLDGYFELNKETRLEFYMDVFFRSRLYKNKRGLTDESILCAWETFIANLIDNAFKWFECFIQETIKYETTMRIGKRMRAHRLSIKHKMDCQIPVRIGCVLCGGNAQKKAQTFMHYQCPELKAALDGLSEDMSHSPIYAELQILKKVNEYFYQLYDESKQKEVQHFMMYERQRAFINVIENHIRDNETKIMEKSQAIIDKSIEDRQYLQTIPIPKMQTKNEQLMQENEELKKQIEQLKEQNEAIAKRRKTEL